MWVKRVGFVMSGICPVDPKQQTFPDPIATSHLGHEPTSQLVVRAMKIRWRLFWRPRFTLALQNVLKSPIAIIFACSFTAAGDKPTQLISSARLFFTLLTWAWNEAANELKVLS